MVLVETTSHTEITKGDCCRLTKKLQKGKPKRTKNASNHKEGLAALRGERCCVTGFVERKTSEERKLTKLS